MLKCPGVDQSLIAFPEEHLCPNCKSKIEIWSDEKLGKCNKCNEIIRKSSIADSVIEYAKELGVSDAKHIEISAISVEERLAEICKNDKCPGYGSAPSCPPHVMNLNKFRSILSEYHSAVIFKFDIPTNVLFGNERHEVLHLLHETASSIKEFAINNGYSNAMAIAAGSCKQIFCKKYNDCPVINDGGQCRYPQKSCPSMSGLGINFNKITKLLNWDKENTDNQEPTSNMAGIVLLKI